MGDLIRFQLLIITLYFFATLVHSSPIAHWDFEDGRGDRITDRSGNGNHATLFGKGGAWVNGKYGGGYQFNGTRFAQVNSIVGTGDFSITLFLKTTQSYGSSSDTMWYNGAGIVDSYNPSTAGGDFGLSMSVGRVAFGTGGVQDSTLMTPQSYNDGNWWGIAVCRTSASGKIRITTSLNGGTSIETQTQNTGALNSIDRIVIGVIQGLTNNLWSGVLDEVKIYNRYLAQDEASRIVSGNCISDEECASEYGCSSSGVCVPIEETCLLPCPQGSIPDRNCNYCIIDHIDDPDIVRFNEFISGFASGLTESNYQSDLKFFDSFEIYKTAFEGKLSLPRFSVTDGSLTFKIAIKDDQPFKIGSKLSTLSRFSTPSLTSVVAKFETELASWTPRQDGNDTLYDLSFV